MFSSSPIVLTTKRLLLRELTPALFNQLFLKKPKAEIMAYLHLQTDQEFEEMEERYTKGITTYHQDFKGFHLLDRETKQVIGHCDYHTWVPGHRRAEIGYAITDQKYKNKGLMTEALESILTFGFRQMNLYRVEALVATYNTPSLQLVQHFGFRREGLLRNHYLVNGQLEDSVMFSLLKPEFAEWQAQQLTGTS
ncbi:GNAT family N-acetyltransferase [Pontibacter mangrovi]|uniref:GNAT family N-acetyltransferase n=1 Tax=Pontibacter mangrovi TaxID=2589816 RepID=A0A501W445_9BACT|nr:GNAT family protein [Pontibacter mangrovi]TPE44359.1 GNAT family N-acetyltransferase [Pontibacter mangrovi]